MTRIVTRIRRTGLLLVGVASMAAALALQFSGVYAFSIASANTAQLVCLLGLLVLPAMTLGLLELNRRLAPAR